MIKAAVIGTGGYAFQIIKRIWDLPELYSIQAVTSIPGFKSNGLEQCKKRDIPVYDNINSMLEAVKGNVDIIFVPTSIHSHYEIAKQCIKAGFDICIEKPPVAVVQQYDDLLKELRNNNCKAAIGFQYLYSPLVQQIKSDICNHKYGKVLKVRSFGAWIRYDWYYNLTEWGGNMKFEGKWVLDGSISNPLAHMLANSLYFASDEPLKMATPKTIEAQMYRAHKINAEDTSSIRIITADNVEVISNATLCPNEDSEIETVVECEYADIIYTDFDHCRVEWKNGKIEDFAEPCEQRVYMLESIAQSIKENKPFKSDLTNCRAFTLAVNCAYESSKGIHTIDDIYIERIKQDDTIKTVISSIDTDIRTAHENGRLFSECHLPWSVASDVFICEGYNRFPQSDLIEKSIKVVNLMKEQV